MSNQKIEFDQITSGEYLKYLWNKPTWHELRVSPDMVFEANFNNDPEVSYVVPVFNHENIIIACLQAIDSKCKNKYDLIVIDDCSDDGSLATVKKYLDNVVSTKLCQALLIANKVPIYETACDNIGFYMSRTEYIIEVQSDIVIDTDGFDEEIIKLLKNKMIGTVSGRAAHTYADILGKKSCLTSPVALIKYLFNGTLGVGYMGEDIFDTDFKVPTNNYISETNCRGPWGLKKSELEKVGYLDERYFFLGFDDHDLNRRFYESSSLLAAYTPVRLITVSENGSTRKKRTGLNEKVFKQLKGEKNKSPDFLNFLKNYRPFLLPQKIKNQELK